MTELHLDQPWLMALGYKVSLEQYRVSKLFIYLNRIKYVTLRTKVFTLLVQSEESYKKNLQDRYRKKMTVEFGSCYCCCCCWPDFVLATIATAVACCCTGSFCCYSCCSFFTSTPFLMRRNILVLFYFHLVQNLSFPSLLRPGF